MSKPRPGREGAPGAGTIRAPGGAKDGAGLPGLTAWVAAGGGAGMAPPRPADSAPTATDLREELRSVLIPQARWHYVFHLLVVLVSSAYWVGSWVGSGGGSLAETVLYRPHGDSQLWPVITALSQLNWGDPVDALNYGEGIVSFPIASLLPYGLACAVFGPAGYIVGDLVLSWAYFVAVTLLLRRCGVGAFWSLVVGYALAVGGLQAFAGKFGAAFGQVLNIFGGGFAVTGFPNLLELPIYEKRIHRPMVTEIYVVLLLWVLMKLWREPRLPSLKTGLGIGVLFGLLVQGDFFSAGTLGLVFAGVTIGITIANGGRVAWRLIAGAVAGAALASAFFVGQRLMEHPDIPRRLGLVEYERTTLWLLPGYPPLVRLAIVGILIGAVCRRCGPDRAGASLERIPGRGWGAAGRRLARRAVGWVGAVWSRLFRRPLPPEASIAWFVGLVMACAWLVQPVQLFVAGKGAQVYHYQHNILVFYAYALTILSLVLLKLVLPGELRVYLARLAQPRRLSQASGLAVLLALVAVLGMEKPLERVRYSGTVRGASVEHEPWAAYGRSYRPALRELDREFRTNATLRAARTFTAFNHDVFVLLAAFHGKRAYNPDASLSTLGDEEIENRLCEMAKICRLAREDKVMGFFQTYYVNCYFLGCNKYRFATDKKFSDDSDYNPEAIALLADKAMPKYWGWLLAIPKSELRRLFAKYERIAVRPSDPAPYPDLIVTTQIEKEWGLVPAPELYSEIHVSSIFTVYWKRQVLLPRIVR